MSLWEIENKSSAIDLKVSEVLKCSMIELDTFSRSMFPVSTKTFKRLSSFEGSYKNPNWPLPVIFLKGAISVTIGKDFKSLENLRKYIFHHSCEN